MRRRIVYNKRQSEIFYFMGLIMEFIRVTGENIEKEHICCAISNNNDVQVSSKKAWLNERFDDGLVFLKSSERGKCFIEYIPAEKAWNPITADGYMYIDCLWVAGSLKGHGYGADLLNACIKDSKSKGKTGLCILSSKKKKPFLADPKFLRYKGFTVCDEADKEKGYVLYYTNQCPFNAKYVPVAEAVAKGNNVPFRAVHLQSREDAQNDPTPITTYALFYNGEYLTNEQMNDKRFLKLLSK